MAEDCYDAQTGIDHVNPGFAGTVKFWQRPLVLG